jgi:NAD(P)-dependent dehydrogenase (short-subunit alcohol dehydrogenase family)
MTYQERAMTDDQSRRWVLVTGASGGIGQAIVQTLGAAGFGVIAASRAAADVPAAGQPGQVCTLALDLTSEASVRAAVEKTHEITGGALFALVNNAGIALPGAFELSSMADARRQIETNIYGTLNLTHALLPSLRTSRGRLVVVTSVVGRLAMPFNAVHCATKHFLEGMFSSLRIELRGAGVHTVIIEPGTIHTPMIEKFSAAAERALTRVPPTLDALYGRPLRSMVARMQRHIATGSPPEVVAEAVLRALTAPQPHSRYAVGRLARRTTTLAKLLPDRAKDRLVSRMLNI